MASAANASFDTLMKRRFAADAILQGQADGDIATVLSTAHSAGYADGEVVTGVVGGIINGINR